MTRRYIKVYLILISLFSLFGCVSSVGDKLSNIVYIPIPIEQIEKDYELTPFEDPKTHLYGYKDKINKIVIAPIFSIALAFNKYGIADVALGYSRNKWFKINTTGQLLTESYFFDNGPDYYVNGLSRFIEKNKIGFINHNASIVIPAKFDWASAFSYSMPIAIVCNGCQYIKFFKEEYGQIKGGKWGAVNIYGEIIVPIEFEDYAIHNGLVIFRKDDQFYKLMHNDTKSYVLKKIKFLSNLRKKYT